MKNTLKHINQVHLYECLGLLYGDGSLKNAVSFANTCPKLVQHVLRFILDLGVDAKSIRVYLQVYWPWSIVTDRELIVYWTAHLSPLCSDNFKKVKRKQRVARGLRNRKEPSKFGLAEFWIYSESLRLLLLEMISKISECSNEKRFSFLRGLIAAEGSVKNDKGVLREVRIGSTKSVEQVFIRSLLQSLNIRPAPAIYTNYIAISGFFNLRRLSRYSLCSLHPEKELLFQSGYQKLEQKKQSLPGV